MNEKLLQKKSILLKRISEREYYQLLSYVESIFLADADLIILLARKFSNLFDALLPLVIAENRIWIEKKYQEMVNRRGGKAPVIISSRALEYYEEDIKNHTYESIMLVDDMIVHGGTLQGIYKKIFDMFEKNEVRPSLDVKAYASQRGLRILGSGDYGVDIVNRDCSVAEWRTISTKIVEVLYIMSQPYTSYVPNCKYTFGEHGDEIGARLFAYVSENNALDCITDTELSEIKTYIWMPDKTYDFKFICFSCVRIHVNLLTKEIAVVPFVSMNPVSNELVEDCLEVLKSYIDESFYTQIYKRMDEISYRAVVYILSAFLAKIFFREAIGTNCQKQVLMEKEEKSNYGESFLSEEVYNSLTAEEIPPIFKVINDRYAEKEEYKLMELVLSIDGEKPVPEFKEMKACLNKFVTDFEAAKGQVEDHSEKEKVNGEFVRGYAYKTCLISEQKWDKFEQSEEGKSDAGGYPLRLKGYPVSLIIDKIKDGLMTKRDAVISVLRAMDMGSASLLAESFHVGGLKYAFIPLIHDGEENYKYIEDNYFPFLYGGYLIEQRPGGITFSDAGNLDEKKSDMEEIVELKQSFFNQMKAYWNEQKKYFLNEDIEDVILNGITEEYGLLLDRGIFAMQGDPAVQKAIEIADSIIDEVRM